MTRARSIGWVSVVAIAITLSGIVWTGAEKISGKASADELREVERQTEINKTSIGFMRDEIHEIRQDVKEILRAVRSSSGRNSH